MPETVIRPPGDLRPRDGDEDLSIQQIEQIAKFGQLSEQPDWEEWPGMVALRRYKPGEVICRQDEPGWTAFYILTTEELLQLREGQLALLRKEQPGPNAPRARWLEGEIERLKRRREQLQAPDAADTLRRVATVKLAAPAADRPAQSFFGRFWQAVTGGPRRDPEELDTPVSIPNDGPDVPCSTRQTFLTEGELFGEMSCQYRTPRTATIEASAEFYALEMFRNLLDKMLTNRNKAFKEENDRIYRRRVLELDLRNLPLFRDLAPDDFARLRDRLRERVELIVPLEPDALICDEHERSDSLYLIRSGFVKVMAGVSSLLSPADVLNWPDLCKGLLAGEAEASGPRRKVWERLAGPACADAVRAGASGKMPEPAAQQEIVHALNDVLKTPKLHKSAEFKSLLGPASLEGRARGVKDSPVKWPDTWEARRLNRLLLAALYPGTLRDEEERPPQILAYKSRGAFIGETGLVDGRPRNATCVAYDHPDSKFGRVELVRIDAALFWEVIRSTPGLEERVRRVSAERARQTRARLAEPPGSRRVPLEMSEDFEKLGLIQGQRLMFVDLHRCTRCDECVRACVNTHADARSRLFLDGPRLDRHLVPATCRQCRDPVCLIGCPVGSIHKGGKGEIVIEDWCIGCGRCAEQCPYGSIQMHNIGLLPRRAAGWRCAPVAAGDPETVSPWAESAYDDRAWPEGAAPFQYNRRFKDSLAGLARPPQAKADGTGGAVGFRRAVVVAPAALAKCRGFHLQIKSSAAAVAVWINGTVVDLKRLDRPRREKEEEWSHEAQLDRQRLQAGRNLVAVLVGLPLQGGDLLLELGLYQLSEPVVPLGAEGAFAQEVVMRKAVVCDLCSSLADGPACVKACPHEAAIRFDARKGIPTW
jgi:Fe-S-cluster-containing hydrogenase component 2/CRP-like cAMP-binding protein